VTLTYRTTLAATIVGTYPATDLAIIPADTKNLLFAAFGESASLCVRQIVMASAIPSASSNPPRLDVDVSRSEDRTHELLRTSETRTPKQLPTRDSLTRAETYNILAATRMDKHNACQ